MQSTQYFTDPEIARPIIQEALLHLEYPEIKRLCMGNTQLANFCKTSHGQEFINRKLDEYVAKIFYPISQFPMEVKSGIPGHTFHLWYGAQEKTYRLLDFLKETTNSGFLIDKAMSNNAVSKEIALHRIDMKNPIKRMVSLDYIV